MNCARELPRYKCHKQVWALKIARLAPCLEGVELHFDDQAYAPIQVSSEWAVQHKVASGGYFVVYDGGYKSFSPAAAFEAGYTLMVGSGQ